MADVVSGIRWGLAIAGVLTILALITVPISGGFVLRTRQGWEINIGAVIAVYVVTGVVAGAIAGAFRPLLRSRLGAAFVGVLGATPLGLGTIVGRNGPTLWTSSEVLTAVFFPLLFGIPMGLILRVFLIHYSRAERKLD